MSSKTAVHLLHQVRKGKETFTQAICGRLTWTKDTRPGRGTRNPAIVDCKHCRDILATGEDS